LQEAGLLVAARRRHKPNRFWSERPINRLFCISHRLGFGYGLAHDDDIRN
jgi:hypothetical protein